MIERLCIEIRRTLARMRDGASLAEHVIPQRYGIERNDWLPGCLLSDAEFCQILLKHLADTIVESSCTESRVSSDG